MHFQSPNISLLMKFTNASVKRFHFVFLLHEFRSHFSKQTISVFIKKRFRNICGDRESDERFITPKNLLMSEEKSPLSEKASRFNQFWLENNATCLPVLIGYWDELYIKFARSEWQTCDRSALASRSCRYNGEASRARSCSSSTSDSAGVAMLSGESQVDALIDWLKDKGLTRKSSCLVTVSGEVPVIPVFSKQVWLITCIGW